ncbi:hypothetical protein [Vibrio sp. WXL210]|uniref:hypothetical protein n=1 Tax=Vibrio sp. WXL210 TaxID=3450709 RepID=UPI003EC8723E
MKKSIIAVVVAAAASFGAQAAVTTNYSHSVDGFCNASNGSQDGVLYNSLENGFEQNDSGTSQPASVNIDTNTGLLTFTMSSFQVDGNLINNVSYFGGGIGEYSNMSGVTVDSNFSPSMSENVYSFTDVDSGENVYYVGVGFYSDQFREHVGGDIAGDSSVTITWEVTCD